jgi:hypothetical protein
MRDLTRARPRRSPVSPNGLCGPPIGFPTRRVLHSGRNDNGWYDQAREYTESELVGVWKTAQDWIVTGWFEIFDGATEDQVNERHGVLHIKIERH